MSELILPRRRFLLGAASLLAASAAIRAAKLMPIRPVAAFAWESYSDFFDPFAFRSDLAAYGFAGYTLTARRDGAGTIHVFRNNVEPREVWRFLAENSA